MPKLKDLSPACTPATKEEGNFHSPTLRKTLRLSSDIMETRKSRETTLSISDVKARDRVPLFKVNVRTQLLKNYTNPF